MMQAERQKHTGSQTVLELKVRNHPGVMSHVCGLLARRAYNMEAIVCLPMKDRRFSRIWLLIDEGERLEQVIQQIHKLHDVLRIDRHGEEHRMFTELETLGMAGADSCVAPTH
ncbi:MAG: acetolactate synthase small subunit [Natronospirillum sp.]